MLSTTLYSQPTFFHPSDTARWCTVDGDLVASVDNLPTPSSAYHQTYAPTSPPVDDRVRWAAIRPTTSPPTIGPDHVHCLFNQRPYQLARQVTTMVILILILHRTTSVQFNPSPLHIQRRLLPGFMLPTLILEIFQTAALYAPR
jgi:hypothetical protein